jgi:hypothetical protein
VRHAEAVIWRSSLDRWAWSIRLGTIAVPSGLADASGVGRQNACPGTDAPAIGVGAKLSFGFVSSGRCGTS